MKTIATICLSRMILFVTICSLQTGCDSGKSSVEKGKSVRKELSSLGITSNDAFNCELKAKCEGDSLLWLLEVWQGVYVPFMGYGPESEKLGKKLEKELVATCVSSTDGNRCLKSKNILKIKFTDKDGFVIAEASTGGVEQTTSEGETVRSGDFGTKSNIFIEYRGKINIGAESISKITGFTLEGILSDELSILAAEAQELAKQKQKQKQKQNN